MRLCIVFLLLFAKAWAQQVPEKFRHLTVANGLSRNWIRNIYQDKLGFYWIGTADGLNRYDGISFKVYKYKSNDKNTLNNNHIQTIFEDSKGRLWVGTQAGLNLYDRAKDAFTPIVGINNFVTSLYELDANRLLIGSPGGLFICNLNNLSIKHIHNNINIEEIFCDRNKVFWLTTFEGFYTLNIHDFSYKKVKIESEQKIDVNNLIHSIFQDSKGSLWLGTNSEGLWQMTYNLANPSVVKVKAFKNIPQNSHSIGHGAIYALAEDHRIGIENGGISLLNINDTDEQKANFQRLIHEPFDLESLSDNSIHYLYKDNQNAMWVGTYGGGVSYQSSYLQKFGHYKLLPGGKGSINNNRVNTLYDEADHLYIGTEMGLNILNKKTGQYQYYTHNPNDKESIGSNAVWSIMRDNDKNLLVGLWNGGLNIFNEKTRRFKRYHYDEANPLSIGSNSMLDMIQTKDNNIWIATMRGGLNKFDIKKGEFERYRVNHGNINCVSSDWILDILESSDGLLWLSTSQAVDIFDRKNNKFHNFRHDPNNPKSISYNGGIVLFEDSKKHIWIGTGNGLNRFNKKDSSFTHYTKVHGLPDNSIQGIEEDNKGNLWLSTNNGISKMVQAVNLPQKPIFINYNTNDGLQGNEFIGRSSFKNSQGHIYFGGSNGYNVFDPNKIESNPLQAKISFTNLLVFNKAIKAGDKDSPISEDISIAKKITLQPWQSVFTLEFASLNILAPENNRYAFYLDGFENKWNYVGNQHNATYTNLDPGTYTFRVKATNNDGLWNEKGIAIEVEVLPSWWQSNFAKFCYLALFALAIYYFRKHTIISINLKNKLWQEHLEKQRTEELNEMKSQFFTNVSHELRTPITLILGPLSQLMHNPAMATQLGNIYKNANRLKTLVDQVLDYNKMDQHMLNINYSSCQVVDFCKKVLNKFADVASQKNIKLVFTANSSSCMVATDEDKLEKILSNLLSNAIKFTPAGGEITLSLHIDAANKALSLQVQDTGPGIASADLDFIFDRFYSSSKWQADKTGSGIGLNFSKKLAELMGGTLSAQNNDKGALFNLNVPINIEKLEEQGAKSIILEEQTSQADTSYQSIKYNQQHTILIIDDNIDICQYICSVLEPTYHVIWHSKPLEAVEKLAQYMPDLIISDVMMPQMDGYQLCSYINDDRRFSHIPLILLTAKSALNDVVQGLDYEADDYITKPFEPELLKARIGNLIRKKEKLRQVLINNLGIVDSKVPANSLDKQFMEEVIKIINEKYSEPQFNVNQIIEQMAMSRSVFYKKFKALSNQSINDLINIHRLNKAMSMLNSKLYTVSQVAYECGFSDPAYFSRVFKEYFNQNPKDVAGSNFFPISEN